MDYLVLIVILIAISFTIAIVGMAILTRKKIFVPWLKGTFGLLLILLAVFFTNIGINLMEVRAVRDAKAVAKIRFTRAAPQVYKAQITDFNKRDKAYVIKGDLWQIEVQLLEWTVNGFKNGYRLNQLNGRYLTLEQEGEVERTPSLLRHALKGFDLWHLVYQYPGFPFVDAKLEKSNFIPMADDAEFTVGFFPDIGLSIRPLNDAAEVVFESVE